jgi:hypothetical protein
MYASVKFARIDRKFNRRASLDEKYSVADELPVRIGNKVININKMSSVAIAVNIWFISRI